MLSNSKFRYPTEAFLITNRPYSFFFMYLHIRWPMWNNDLNWCWWRVICVENLALLRYSHLLPGTDLQVSISNLKDNGRSLIPSQAEFPSPPFLCRLSSVSTSCLEPVGLPSSRPTFALFVFYQEVRCEKLPLKKLRKSCFLYFAKLFVSSCIFHKCNLCLITSWPWQDLESQNLIIHLDLLGYPVKPNTENFFPAFLTNGHAVLACILTGCSITQEEANLIVDSPESILYLANMGFPPTSLVSSNSGPKEWKAYLRGRPCLSILHADC